MAETAISLWQRLRYTRLRDAVRGRFDASLDWRRVVAEAELPDEIAMVVNNTVRAVRLWNREKVDVTRELVAHFQDGLARGQQATSLIDTFGDPMQTAALIRRAKKRGRPPMWQVWHYGWLTLAALLAAYILTGLYMLTLRPSVTTDYLAIVNKAALAVPEAERAWPVYRGVLLELGGQTTPGEYNPDCRIPHIEAKPGDADWPQVAQLLKQHAVAVEQLRTAAGLDGLGFVPATSFAAFGPVDQQLFGVTATDEERAKFESETLEDRWLVSTMLPNVQQLRWVALVLAADTRRAAIAGEGSMALADIHALLGVCRHSQETPFLISLMVADRIRRTAIEMASEILVDHAEVWSDDDLRNLAHSIAGTEIDWHRGFRGERASFYDVMQRLYTDNGEGNGRITNAGLQKIEYMIGLLEAERKSVTDEWNSRLRDLAITAVGPAGLVGMASRAEVAAVYERYLGQQEANIDCPLWKLEPELLDVNVGHWSAMEKLRYLPVAILLPTLSTLRNSIETSRGMRDGVLVGIALEMYHREHSSWPKTLDELAPQWLPSIPTDRITGKPLAYKIVDDQPVVFSFGVDQDDDDGIAPTDESGKHDSGLASPNHFRPQPVMDSTHDGDWVIWSTVKSE